jgi:hypothetical protein
MHDIIFCFERSDKKYYGAILLPATNIVILNSFQDFFLSFPSLLLIFSSYHFLNSLKSTEKDCGLQKSKPVLFSSGSILFFIKLLLRCARPLSGYEFTNSLTCVTPTKILLLLNHLKTIILKHFTDMLVCNAS